MERVPHLERGRFFGETSRRRLVADLVISETLYPPSLIIPPHDHELASISVILHGAFDQQVGQHSRECRPGMTICHPEGERHSNAHRGASVRMLCVEIGRARLSAFRETARVLDRPAQFAGGPIGTLADKLAQEFHHDDGASALAIEALVLEILAESCRATEPARASPPRWLATALDYQHGHFHETVAIADVAQVVGVHPAHLARVFREHKGATIGDYLRSLRIEAARRQLSSSDRPLLDIAVDAGFADQSHSSRLFRAATGTTPAAYRRLHRVRS
jgi:AraC family transcriptional regulator